MTHKFYFRNFLGLLLLLIFFSACHDKPDQEITQVEEINTSQSIKYRKDPNKKKKGIEHMADYMANIRKPIDAKESSYEKGYLMKEHQKAKKGALGARNSSIIRFKERGPVNVPGRIRGIAVSPDDEDKWYAGTVGGGLWGTEDAGKTWENLTDYKIPNLSTSTVVISQTNPRTLYVGTGEPFGNLDAIGGVGLLKTTNAGRSWDYLNQTKDFGSIGRLALNPEDDNNLIVASDTGVYVTTDGGKTWQHTYDKGNVQDLNPDPKNFNVLYGGVDDIGVIKSSDGGITWNLVLDRDDYNSNHNRFELDVSPACANKLFVSVYTGGGLATTAVNTDFYVSSDSGNSWTLIGYEGDPATGNLITGQGWYDNVIMAHPFNDDIFYTGGVIVNKVEVKKKSKDVKDKRLVYTATPIAAGYNDELNDYVHVDQHGISFITKFPEKKFKLLLANDGGMYSTDYLIDPGTTENDWSTAATGLNCTQFYGADKRNGVQDYTAGAQDNGTWISLTNDEANDETQYTKTIGGDGFEVIWNYDDPNKFIGGSQFGRLVRYVNGQGFLATHGDAGSANSPFYTKVTNANNNPDVIFSPGRNGVWRSANFGESWELSAIPSNFAVLRNGGARVTSALDVEVSVANPDVVWGGSAMTESGSFVLHVSQDNGNSFTPTSSFIDPRGEDFSHGYFLSGIEASPIDKDRAYALFSSKGAAKVLKTEDLGQTWEDISGFSTEEDRGFPDVAIYSLIEMPFDKDRLWVGTDIGVLETLDGGKNWSLLAGLPAFAVYQMKIVNNQVVMATHGRGVWTATLEELEGYEPPAYYAPPTIVSVDQQAIDNTNAIVTYVQKNEDIDLVKVFVDGEEVGEIDDNIAQGEEFTYVLEDLEEGLHTVGLQAISNQTTSIVSNLKFDIIDYNDAEEVVSIPTFEESDVYTFGGQFVLNTLDETVSQPVLSNVDHPYLNGKEYSTILKHPITVTSEYKDFVYQDVAIVENNPTPNQFYDFVLIEASTDLKEWKRLDIYDAERFPEWKDAFDQGATSINDDLFKEQTIDLLNTFEEGDVVVIRFRLITDGFVDAFGWAIRSINPSLEVPEEEEEEEVATVPEEEVADAETEKPEVTSTNHGAVVYPTFSNGNVKVSSDRPITNGKIEVFSMSGKLVHTQYLGTLYKPQQDVVLSDLGSGMYLTKITGDNGTDKTSRIIIK